MAIEALTRRCGSTSRSSVVDAANRLHLLPMCEHTGIVVLIGAPGAGKSLLGRALEETHSSVQFLNVGEQLREEGLVEQYAQDASPAVRDRMRNRAQAIVFEACAKLSYAEVDISRVLVLECIKEVEDAYVLMDVLQQHNLPLLQVLLIHGDELLTWALRSCYSGAWSCSRDAERMVQERQSKWQAQAAGILQVFAAQGVLAEVWYESKPSPPRRPYPRYGYKPASAATESKPQTFSTYRNSLAAAGYGSSSAPAWLHSIGWCDERRHLVCSSSGGGRNTLKSASLDQLVAHPVQQLVSARMVVHASVRQQVISNATSSTGLKDLGQRLPVPSQSVSTTADAGWVAVPGRYMVSRKADGTRHLLIVSADGTHYLMDRAGGLFAYPMSAYTSVGNSSSLPPGTVLDGELIWIGVNDSKCGRAGFFLAFDALCIGGERVWGLRLQDRIKGMVNQLHLEEAEACVRSQVAAPTSYETAEAAAASSARPLCLDKKQQAQALGSDSVLIVYKQHVPVTAAALQQLQETQTVCPYPTDGLVFTPADMPYVLGMRELMMKWQLPAQIAADISGEDLVKEWQALRCAGQASAAQQPHLSKGIVKLPKFLVYECVVAYSPTSPEIASAAAAVAAAASLPHQYRSRAREAAAKREQHMQEQQQQRLQRLWRPVSVRWDKRSGNDAAAVELMAKRIQQGAWVSYDELISTVREVQAAPAIAPAALHISSPPVTQAKCMSAASSSSSSSMQATQPVADRDWVHPARSLPFPELYSQVMSAVKDGQVERTVDTATGLEVFNYRLAGRAKSSIGALCRGLVLHPPSQSVVATPFVKFYEPGDRGCKQASTSTTDPTTSHKDDDAEETKHSSHVGLLRGVGHDWRSAAMYSNEGTTFASASFKIDGSLVIAFLWQGQLKVTTRRRMNSEQAVWALQWMQQLWALQWMQQRGCAAAMETGWTYLFEAVYRDNAHIIAHPFEGLVLLGAVSPHGQEVQDPDALYSLARRLGVLATPSLHGPAQQLLERLSEGTEVVAGDILISQGSSRDQGGNRGSRDQRRKIKSKDNSRAKDSSSSSSDSR